MRDLRLGMLVMGALKQYKVVITDLIAKHVITSVFVRSAIKRIPSIYINLKELRWLENIVHLKILKI